MSFPRLFDTRIPALDGIRGLAIGLVLVWHDMFGILNRHGGANHPRVAEILKFSRLTWSGVDLFFVLSGFLIGGILLDAIESERYFAPFYLRRILPLYAVVLVALLPLARNSVPIAYYPTFLQNLWMAKHATFGSLALGVTWSLAVEEQFYLTLPTVSRYISRLQYVVAGMILGAPLLRIVLRNLFPDNFVLTYVLTPCRADALGLGVAAALMVRTPKVWNAVLVRRAWIYAGLFGTFLLVLALLGSSFVPFSNRFFGLEYSMLAVFYFFLLLSVLVSDRLQSLFSIGWLTYMGTIAYGLYLLHRPAMLVVHDLAIRLHVRQSGWVQLAEAMGGIGLAFIAAATSWKYLEKPLIRRGHRYRYETQAYRSGLESHYSQSAAK